MDIPYSRWYAAIPHRRSRRRFNSVEIDSNGLAELQALCREFRPFPEARAELITQSPEQVLKGIVGYYGKVKGAPALIAFIGNTDDPYIQQKVGYLGEGILLEATAMGMATCWVGGFFRPEVAASIVGTEINEKVLAVTPVGYTPDNFSMEEKIMTGFGRTHRRKPMSELVTGLDQGESSHWIKTALEAARVAPSAVNRQPWRFSVEPDSITVSVDNPTRQLGISKRLDCGIAMLHIEVAALESGVQGRWEFLESPKVARFTAVSGV